MGLAQPRLIDVGAVLNGFGGEPWSEARQRYLEWLRAVSEARWAAAGLEETPWWRHAGTVDEIATPDRNRRVITFDGRTLADSRPRLDLDELCRRFEAVSGHAIEELASRRRSRDTLRGRIEFTIVAVERYALRSCDVADALNKDPASVSRWLGTGLILQRQDHVFRQRIDALYRATSRTVVDISDDL